MKTQPLLWTKNTRLDPAGELRDADLVLFFGGRQTIHSGMPFSDLREAFPAAYILGCSTGGQIAGDDVSDDGVVGVAMRFDGTRLRAHREVLTAGGDSAAAGAAIGKALAADDLAGVFVLSDGLNVNGSKLVAGIVSAVGRNVPVTGGLAGDGAAFEETIVGLDAQPASHVVGAIGFYGAAVRFGHGSAGGWDVFGPRRVITRSLNNVLFELDGEPALDLYERYLGPEEAQGLPGTALLFPLQVFDPAKPEHIVVRTVLAVDPKSRTMTFAGDVPQGWVAQLMRGNFDRLTEGSAEAARQTGATSEDGVAVLVSCIGRRLLMGQRTVDEVEAANAVLPRGLVRVGFYSYGEISPHAASGLCELHNQTMTVTTITEARS